MVHNISTDSDFANFEHDIINHTPSERPTVLYACCTPGLSEFFEEKLSTREKRQHQQHHCHHNQPSNENTITSKRGTIVRRELRYELTNSDITVNPKDAKDCIKPKRKMCFIRKRINKIIKYRPQQRKKNSKDNIITSTPVNFLDSIDMGQECHETPTNIRKWRESMRQENEKPFSANNTFKNQCGHCNRVWHHNWELLYHVREQHSGYRNWFRRSYQCGLCSSSFYLNRFLIWHSRRHHNDEH